MKLDLYFIAFPNDNRFLKLLVLAQLGLETFQTVEITRDIFLFESTGNLDIHNFGTLWYSIPLVTGLSAFIYLCI